MKKKTSAPSKSIQKMDCRFTVKECTEFMVLAEKNISLLTDVSRNKRLFLQTLLLYAVWFNFFLCSQCILSRKIGRNFSISVAAIIFSMHIKRCPFKISSFIIAFSRTIQLAEDLFFFSHVHSENNSPLPFYFICNESRENCYHMTDAG